MLAEEFEIAGTTADKDINGFQEINGLVYKGLIENSSRRTGRSSRQNLAKKEESFRGSLSAVKTMSVQPGVLLKEFIEDKKNPKKDLDFIKVSGGDYHTI